MDKSRLKFPAAGIFFILTALIHVVYMIAGLRYGSILDTSFMLGFMALEITIAILLFCKSRKAFIIIGVTLYSLLSMWEIVDTFLEYYDQDYFHYFYSVFLRYGFTAATGISFFARCLLNLILFFTFLFALIVVIGCRQRRNETGPDQYPSLLKNVWWMPPWLILLTSLGLIVAEMAPNLLHFSSMPALYFKLTFLNLVEIIFSFLAWMLMCKWLAKPYKKLPPVPVQPYVPFAPQQQ